MISLAIVEAESRGKIKKAVHGTAPARQYGKDVFMRAIVVAAAGALVAMAVGSSFPVARSAGSGASAANVISVSAVGSVQVPPDVAYVTVGVTKTSVDAAAAQDAASAVAARALAGLGAMGIPGRDLQTEGITLNPQYDDHGALTGFQATDTLAVTVEHLGQTGQVIDTAVGAGANQSLSVSFGLKDATTAQGAALKAAVAAAKTKAAVVASQLGVSLAGAHFQLTENTNQQVQPANAGIQLKVLDGAVPNTATPVQAGSLTVQETVTMSYTF